MFVNKHVQDVIVVILSVYYVDHLLCHNFSGLNPSGFSAKRKKKKTGKKEGKGRTESYLCQNTPKIITKREEG